MGPGGELVVLGKIVSGGQTGVDRAALDVAVELNVSCGGWCPASRRAEDGAIPSRYPLTETASSHYEERTELNVRDSDATLILTRGAADGGTGWTARLARQQNKPCLILDLKDKPRPEAVREWLEMHRVRVLNIAGPRESKQPGIYLRAQAFLRQALPRCYRTSHVGEDRRSVANEKDRVTAEENL